MVSPSLPAKSLEGKPGLGGPTGGPADPKPAKFATFLTSITLVVERDAKRKAFLIVANLTPDPDPRLVGKTAWSPQVGPR